ncbi:exported hypothetical protein [Candidatus Terasakiella magnetica]|uniref:Uncharacterized protein n=1 Tax=Candidatus Terasakiella magnetica TaxID=1867952 RepID=A0A1C3RKG4_9PROT|nr:transporter substrate-binding domain-containing protein [Candidatus Terasakiella magnetica]SCA57735.1 exported hypothetical protein [Candidatus Terasakiella magnetica]
MLKSFTTLFISLWFCTFTVQAEDVDVRVFYSDIAGMSMEGDQQKGMGRELLETALNAAGLSYETRFLPWSRLLKTASRDPKALMLPLGRTEQREKSYRWIRPIFEAEIGFVSLFQPIDDFETAKSLSSIGVWKDTFFETILVKKGFKNLAHFNDDEQLGKLFLTGRTGAWYGELNESRYRLKSYQDQNDLKELEIYFGKPVTAIQAWLVAGKEFDPVKSEKINAALNALYLSGFADELYAKYYDFDTGNSH